MNYIPKLNNINMIIDNEKNNLLCVLGVHYPIHKKCNVYVTCKYCEKILGYAFYFDGVDGQTIIKIKDEE